MKPRTSHVPDEHSTFELHLQSRELLFKSGWICKYSIYTFKHITMQDTDQNNIKSIELMEFKLSERKIVISHLPPLMKVTEDIFKPLRTSLCVPVLHSDLTLNGVFWNFASFVPCCEVSNNYCCSQTLKGTEVTGDLMTWQITGSQPREHWQNIHLDSTFT
jgi:hypothetical protein